MYFTHIIKNIFLFIYHEVDKLSFIYFTKNHLNLCFASARYKNYILVVLVEDCSVQIRDLNFPRRNFTGRGKLRSHTASFYYYGEITNLKKKKGMQ